MMIRYFLPRSRLYIDDGALSVIVRENYGECARCLVEQGGWPLYANDLYVWNDIIGVVALGSTLNFLWSQNFLYHCADKYLKTMRFVENSNVGTICIYYL